ncbi:hypothetical protein ACQ86B_10030 [Mycolicibacterium aichiense]|uniref:hypothetical protein n=1 Tax=Mycolicibacterium aichiense TaxID=1799 RepID=UPI003D679901
MTNVTQSLEPPEGRIPNQRQPETTAPPRGRRNHGLKKDTLGVPSIFFYIIAAASPLTLCIPSSLGPAMGSACPAHS